MTSSPRVLMSLSAYATEGGFDGRHQPASCFSPVIALGRVSGPGPALELWTRYEEVIEVAARLGIAGVCLELSWARLEPRRRQRDAAAVERYRQVVDFARSRGLWVGVAAIDAAWPAWLGQEAWLMPWVVPVAVDYLRWISEALEADSWSVFAQRDRLTKGFVDRGAGPPWRSDGSRDQRDAARQLDEIVDSLRGGAVEWCDARDVELDDLAGLTMSAAEVHVRSLVRGTGPLASRRGLIARSGDDWVVVADEIPDELLAP